jgi:predicted histone-like DNA-binding protein
MAVGYIRKKQKVNHNGEVKEKYLAKVCYGNHISTEALTEEIVSMSSASPGDVALVLRSLEYCIGLHLSGGDVVVLDNIGTLSPAIHAKVQNRAQDVNQFSIARTGVSFRPSPKLKKLVQDAGVRLVDRKVYDADTHARTKANNE